MLAASLVNCRFECPRALFGYGWRACGGRYSTESGPAPSSFVVLVVSIAVHAPRSDEWSRGKSNEANDKTVQMPKLGIWTSFIVHASTACRWCQGRRKLCGVPIYIPIYWLTNKRPRSDCAWMSSNSHWLAKKRSSRRTKLSASRCRAHRERPAPMNS